MRDLRRATTRQLLLAPAAGAAWSLAVLGALESLYVAPLHLSVLWYALGLYGLAGLGFGLLWALLFGGRARRRDFGLLRLTGQATAWPTFGLAAAAGGFLIYRDLWLESVSQAGVGGWLAMLAVPLAAGLLALVAREVGRGLIGRADRALVVLLVVAVPGVLLGRAVEGSGVEAPALGEAGGADSRPPVLFIVGDALRADALGVYGAGAQATPNLDAFARDAVVFDEAWTGSTWTRPAVATILTGLYPSEHQTMAKSARLPAGLPTLAGLLSGRGYLTVASVTNVNLAPAFGLGRGFDAWGYLPPRPYLLAPVAGARLFLVELWRLGRLRFFPGHREASSYYAEGERVSRQARELIEPLAEAGRPFFAYLHYMEPHDPYFAHPYDGRAYARVEDPDPPRELAGPMHDFYRQEVHHFDGLLGELLAWLRKTGLYDRSLIVICADHGEEFYDHGSFFHGTSLYRELVHVPLLVHFPGGAGAGRRWSAPVSLVDLAPTALAQAGLQPPAQLPGRVLRPPEASGPPPGAAAAVRSVFAEVDHQGCDLAAARQDGWKLIRANPDNPRGLAEQELYDLQGDPRERKNQAGAQPARLDQLSKLLTAGPEQPAAPATVAPERVDIDSATEEQLRALGYTQ